VLSLKGVVVVVELVTVPVGVVASVVLEVSVLVLSLEGMVVVVELVTVPVGVVDSVELESFGARAFTQRRSCCG
jgi:hypothetical protein